jgi:hypothetical protein
MIFNIFNMKFNLFLTYTKNIAQQSLIILFPVMRKVSSYSIQLISALKMNIIIVHPWDVVFPRAFAGINCFIIVKLDAKKNLINANISVNEQPEWFHWAHRRWTFYTYLRHVHVLDHGHFTYIVSALAI